MSVGSGKPSAKSQRQEDALRELALAYPEAHEDHPWGHSAFKVKSKTFLFTVADERGLSLSLKLVASHAAALARPEVEPTGYGLGKHGWITASFGPKDDVPMAQLEQWIAESFRAVAPKTILKRLDLPPPPPPAKGRRSAASRPEPAQGDVPPKPAKGASSRTRASRGGASAPAGKRRGAK